MGDLELDLSIAANNTPLLLEQLQKSPHIYWQFAMKYEEAKRAVANQKLEIKVREATLSRNLRDEKGKALSDAKIERMLFTFDEYCSLHEELNKRKEIEGKCSAIVRALEQRHHIMTTVASLIKHELRQSI